MSGKMMIFGAGAAIGYLLGTRAGRERYDQITSQAKQIWESNTVQEAAGVAQTQAGRLYDEGKKMVSDRAHRMGEQRETHASQNRQLRKRGFAERNQKARPWEVPASMDVPPANPPTTASPPTTPATPY